MRRALDLILSPFVLLTRQLGSTRGHGVDPARDALELALLDRARARELPVLGICRGAQMMSVAEGGTLLWNLGTLYAERPELYTVLPRREVHIAEASHLRRILGCHALLVNSLHFHAVGDPGANMWVVARDPSGVTQAVEHEERPFWIGVQWHPEYLAQDERQQRLFRALVDAARARAV
jgi:putative glutamine amidotransferase